MIQEVNANQYHVLICNQHDSPDYYHIVGTFQEKIFMSVKLFATRVQTLDPHPLQFNGHSLRQKVKAKLTLRICQQLVY